MFMYNWLKIFSVFILLITSFGLSACTANISREKFIGFLEEDIQAGHSYNFVTNKIMKEEYVTVTEPYEPILDDYDPEAWDLENVQYENKIIKLVDDIKNRKCEDVWASLNLNPAEAQDSDDDLIGIFYMEGICLQQNPTQAAIVFKKALAPGMVNPIAAARLGALYWNGKGVEQDKFLAEKYFQTAVFGIANEYFAMAGNATFPEDLNALDYRIWGLTYGQIVMNFVETRTGPWELPEGLLDKIKWLEGLKNNNGQPIVEVAMQFYSGDGDYNKDIENAIIWMNSAGIYFKNEEASFLAAYWLMDEDVCAERQAMVSYVDCHSDFSLGFLFMDSAAFNGNEKALRFLIDYYQNHPDEQWADWSLYQYYLMAKKMTLQIDQGGFDSARDSLSQLEQRVIENWVENNNLIAIREYLPKEG